MRALLETIKKLNWAPDLIHVHGWIASLLPLYLKNYYNEEPMFQNTKVVVSLYKNEIKGKLDKKIVDKIKFDGIDGRFSFLNNVIERELDILQIRDGSASKLN